VKIARLVALSAAVVLVAMASLGAGSALAAKTTLCKTSTISPYCEEGSSYPANTTIEATSASKFKITTSFGVTALCLAPSLKIKTGAESGEPLSASVTTWTVGKCDESCKAEFKNLPYAGSLSRTTGSNGTLTSANGGGGEPRLFLQCGELLSCEYAAPNVNVVGGSSPQLTIPETVLTKKGGSNCPTTATFKPFTYTVSSPTPLYVAEPILPHTRLCKAYESPCSLANSYPAGTMLEAESANVKISIVNFSDWEITCKNASLKAKTLALGAEPMPLEVTESTLTGCTANFAGSCEEAKVITPNPGLRIQGLFTESYLRGYEGFAWKFKCGTPTFTYSCALSFVSTLAYFDNSQSPLTFAYKNAQLSQEPGSGCSSYAHQLTATFKVTAPQPLYIT